MYKILIFLVISFILCGCTTDKNVTKLKKAAKINENSAYKIVNILQSVDVPNIDRIECSSYLDKTHCSLENYEYLFSIDLNINKDGTVYRISDYKNVLYNNGEIKASYKDFNILKSDFINLVENSKNITKQHLKSPISAIFKDWREWGQEMNKDYIYLTSSVDSQNSFGAYLNTSIEFTYSRIHGITEQYKLKEAKIGTIIINNE